jgi:hypothetical protein
MTGTLSYHVSSTAVRGSIQELGLQAPGTARTANWTSEDESDTTSVYLLGSLDDAHEWVEYMYGTRFAWDCFDVWAVETDGLALVTDKNMPDGYDSFRCVTPIGPERLRLAAEIRFNTLGFPVIAAA